MNDFFNVGLENDEKFELTLFDLLGRVVLNPIEYSEQVRIETGNLSSGTFWLRIKVNEKVHWERVEVIR